MKVPVCRTSDGTRPLRFAVVPPIEGAYKDEGNNWYLDLPDEVTGYFVHLLKSAYEGPTSRGIVLDLEKDGRLTVEVYDDWRE